MKYYFIILLENFLLTCLTIMRVVTNFYIKIWKEISSCSIISQGSHGFQLTLSNNMG